MEYEETIRAYYAALTDWEVARVKHLSQFEDKDVRAFQAVVFCTEHEAEYRHLMELGVELRLHGHSLDMDALGLERVSAEAHQSIANEHRRQNDLTASAISEEVGAVETKTEA